LGSIPSLPPNVIAPLVAISSALIGAIVKELVAIYFKNQKECKLMFEKLAVVLLGTGSFGKQSSLATGRTTNKK